MPIEVASISFKLHFLAFNSFLFCSLLLSLYGSVLCDYMCCIVHSSLVLEDAHLDTAFLKQSYF